MFKQPKKEYHLIISDDDKFIDVSQIPKIPNTPQIGVDFDKQTRKQYIGPKLEASELKHSNPEFNKLDLQDLKSKIPTLDMSKGLSREEYFNKLWGRFSSMDSKTGADYDITKSFKFNSK